MLIRVKPMVRNSMLVATSLSYFAKKNSISLSLSPSRGYASIYLSSFVLLSNRIDKEWIKFLSSRIIIGETI